MSGSVPNNLKGDRGNPDPETFYELVSARTFTSHHILEVDNPSFPLYCVQKHESISKKKPDVTIYGGDKNTGPVLGVVRLGMREHAFGIGDPDKLLEEDTVDDRVVWERLWRTNQWNYKSYDFEYESSRAQGQRVRYRWQWTNRGVLGIARDLELRISNPGDEEGDVVAIYQRTDWRLVKKGRFFIKRMYSTEDERERKKWELVVLLTALGILEGVVRR